MANTDIPAWIEVKLFENVLRETVKDFQEIKEFKVFPALAPGENYATVMLKVQTDVLLTNGCQHRQTFMLKVAHDTELYRNEMAKWEMFISESGMYREIKPEFEKLYADAGLDVQFGAKGYKLPVDMEYILLEDLSMRGFRNANRQDCLDMDHCKAVLKKIAQFHAASAVRVEQKGMFEKPYLCGFLMEESKNFMKTMFDSSTPHLMRTVEKLENHHEHHEQLKYVSNHVTDIMFEQCLVDESEFNVLNHGDCWANNIMFQYDTDGKLKETYLVDLQMPRYGSPAQDLMYFIMSSAHIDIKVQQFDYMIKYYYDNLIHHLQLLKYTKPLPKLRDIHTALIKYGIWGFVTVTTVMGAVLCDPTDTANLDNFVGDSAEGDKFKEILFSNNRYVQHLKVVLPWLCYRGAFQ
ncbi:uncharacterized protein LOC135948989 [Calliphora vicina]|uniref:uncharacterized protein LOC135948989 n=1 Tax=Calliphora vicina TaxID=7373 RepID=UPI00325BFA13